MKILSISIISIIIILSSYLSYKYFFGNDLDINLIEQGGFSSLKTPDGFLKTSLNAQQIISSDPSSSVCAVAIKHNNLRYENGYYIWELQAQKDSKLLAYNMTSQLKSTCEVSPESCPCVEISKQESGDVCYLNPVNQESRVYINPYYLNLSDSSSCDFSYDKSPLSLRDKNGNVVSRITLPKGETLSETHTVQIPITQASLNSGCFKASLDIVKINELSNQDCSTTLDPNFYVEGASKNKDKFLDGKSVNNPTGGFYSISANNTSDNVYSVSCYLETTVYNSINSYGFSILGSDNGYIEDFVCGSSCTVERVLDSNTGKVFVSYSHDYSFKETGNYQIICKAK